MPKSRLAWKKKPEEEDFAGALSFLSLIFSQIKSQNLVRALRKAKMVEYAAKDLLRASKLPLLPREEPQVDDDFKKINKGKALAPVLLIRGDISKGIPLIVADGYHRICTICYYDERADTLPDRQWAVWLTRPYSALRSGIIFPNSTPHCTAIALSRQIRSLPQSQMAQDAAR